MYGFVGYYWIYPANLIISENFSNFSFPRWLTPKYMVFSIYQISQKLMDGFVIYNWHADTYDYLL